MHLKLHSTIIKSRSRRESKKSPLPQYEIQYIFQWSQPCRVAVTAEHTRTGSCKWCVLRLGNKSTLQSCTRHNNPLSATATAIACEEKVHFSQLNIFRSRRCIIYARWINPFGSLFSGDKLAWRKRAASREPRRINQNAFCSAENATTA